MAPWEGARLTKGFDVHRKDAFSARSSGTIRTMALPEASSLNSRWDSYVALVDDAVASVLVNMDFVLKGRLKGVDVLHHWALPMRWPGEHGLGTQDEAEGFAAIEDQVSDGLMELGFYPVGRLRTAGYWQVSYYAAEEQGEAMSRVIESVLGKVSARVHAEAASDPEWEYFFGLLCPDAQQMQWMADRDVVMRLVEHGDPLTPRIVQHTIHFRSEDKCREFAKYASEESFDCAIVMPGEEDPRWMIQASRLDPVELDHIHEVADALRRTAIEHDGEYDGWGTDLVAAGSAPPDAD
jgi:hypothetical protein